MRYPCFASFNPDDKFCTDRCEFNSECEKQTPSVGFSESEGEILNNEVNEIVEKLKDTEPDYYLDVLCETEDMDVLRDLADHYGVQLSDPDNIDKIFLDLDDYLQANNPKKTDEVETVEEQPEEDLNEEQSTEGEEVVEDEEPVAEEEPEVKKDELPQDIDVMNLSGNVFTTMVIGIIDSHADLLRAADAEKVDLLKARIDFILPKRGTAAPNNPPKLQKSKASEEVETSTNKFDVRICSKQQSQS